MVEPGQPVPKGGGVYRVGKPYVVAGRTYVPEMNPQYSAVGMASWYGDEFHGRYTANGEIFDKNAITAAHPTLPLPSYVRVTNLHNHKSIVVRVNDRGPYAGNRVIDVSVKTAKVLGFYGNGLAKVKVEYVGRAPLAGSDDRKLLATLRENGPALAQPVQVAADRSARADLFRCTGRLRRTSASRLTGRTGWARRTPATCRPRRTTELAAAARPHAVDRDSRVEASRSNRPKPRLRRFRPTPAPAMMARSGLHQRPRPLLSRNCAAKTLAAIGLRAAVRCGILGVG